MKNIRITEAQLKRIIKNVLNEQSGQSGAETKVITDDDFYGRTKWYQTLKKDNNLTNAQGSTPMASAAYILNSFFKTRDSGTKTRGLLLFDAFVKAFTGYCWINPRTGEKLPAVKRFLGLYKREEGESFYYQLQDFKVSELDEKYQNLKKNILANIQKLSTQSCASTDTSGAAAAGAAAAGAAGCPGKPLDSKVGMKKFSEILRTIFPTALEGGCATQISGGFSIMEFMNSAKKQYYSLRMYEKGSKDSYVDIFSNGSFKRFNGCTNVVATGNVECYQNTGIVFKVGDKIDSYILNNAADRDLKIGDINTKGGTTVTTGTTTTGTTVQQLPQAKTEEELASGSSFLYRGMKGEMITYLQNMLKRLGFYTGEPTGVFDAATYNAVKEAQKSGEIKVDGIVGKGFYDKFYGMYKRLSGTTTPVTDVASTDNKPLDKELEAPLGGLEGIQQAREDAYYADPGRKLFVDNINNNLQFRDPQTRRVLLWKGQGLKQTELDNLNTYLDKAGYQFEKAKNKGDGEFKYKWVYRR